MSVIDINKFKFGIEHEFPVIKNKETFVDFSNTSFEELQKIVNVLPVFDSDYKSLRIGDLGIRYKRWYLEGLERFDQFGIYSNFISKGFEIRTPMCESIDEVIGTLKKDEELWQKTASDFGVSKANVSFNPYKDKFEFNPPLNDFEIKEIYGLDEYRTDFMHMMTYGPDISISNMDIKYNDLIDIGKKLNFYSPFVVPFSFSSPFYCYKLWGGLSRRTFYRTGLRPATLVYIENKDGLIDTKIPFTKMAGIPAEIGRIEFKSFDMIPNVEYFRALIVLLLGIINTPSLSGRTFVPDKKLHELSGRFGFRNDYIYENTCFVIKEIKENLPKELLKNIIPLEEMLQKRISLSDSMIDRYNKGESIMEIIS